MQTFGFNLLVNFDFLVENKLTLDAWFILYCLSDKKNKSLLNTYVHNCGKIKVEIFIDLEDKGFINLGNRESITLDVISITNKGKELFNEKGSSEENNFIVLFQQLRNTYPIKVPAANGTFRRLHGDLARCKKLYHKILFKDGKYDIDLHKSILKAIEREIQERNRGGNLPFMQALVTYLHQQNYLQYIDVEDEEIIRDKGDDI